MVSIMLNVLLSMIIGIIRNPLYYVETAPEQPALNSYSSADIQREIKFYGVSREQDAMNENTLIITRTSSWISCNQG